MRRLQNRLAALVCAAALACADESTAPLPNLTALADATGAVTTTGLPARVTDLATGGATDGAVTLTFTHVDDGTGSPANYDIRYARSPISWGSAQSAAAGSCALSGKTIGASITCAVSGLSANSPYQFQVVAYRGTLNVNAAFGPLSSIASGTTAPAVAAIAISPSSTTDSVGRTRQFRAALTDVTGGTLSGIAVQWTSSNPAVMTVDTAGLATATGAGSATITASAGGKTASAAAGVVPRAPGVVTDLAIAGRTDSSIVISFTEVAGGNGSPANYEVRVAQSPLTWWVAAPASRGTCASLAGGTIGATRTCTILGLTAETAYQVQLVTYRGTLNLNAVFGALSNVAGATTMAKTTTSTSECASPRAGWIWCDDFEQDRLSRYFEYDNAGGRFVRLASTGYAGSTGMRASWNAGSQGAGALHLAVGRTPAAYFRPADAGTANYRELYWRMYVKHQAGWVGGGGDKLSRAFIFANGNWAQAAIGHVWSGNSGTTGGNYLRVDPASGTDAAGNLLTTSYNDFAHLRWIGAAQGTTPVFDAAHVGQWYCVEARLRLNDPGQSNGVQELWINGQLEAQSTGLNLVGSYSQYGLNAVYFENYWNAGSVTAQSRVFDNIVVSTTRIGCLQEPSPARP